MLLTVFLKLIGEKPKNKTSALFVAGGVLVGILVRSIKTN
jgi:hypothetical protein